MGEAQFDNAETASQSGQKRSLRERAIVGSIWTLASHVLSQVLRLGSNLVLTRLLFPEAFGLMALVQTFLIGLEMFSDIGIRPSVIQNQRGQDPAFLNTAWTIQVFRGCALWMIACLLAYPTSEFFHEPMLLQLLPVVGLTSLISGFNSTKLATANRQLNLGTLTLLELGSQVVGLIVMIAGSWLWHSVWALVWGGIVASLTSMVLSHVVLEGEFNRLYWDKEAFKELHRFGRWIFLSTVLTFISSQGDRLILAHLLDVRFLGIYTLALTMSRVASEAVYSVGSRVLFPSYSELVRDRPDRLSKVLRKARIIQISICWSASIFFIFFGKFLIHILYDDRYTEAGWILQTLPLGALIAVISYTYSNVLLAKGKTFTISFLLAIQIGVQLLAMILGAYWGGQRGVIIGIAGTAWIMYPIMATCYARIAIWQPEIDLPLIVAASGIATFILLSQ